MRVTLIRTILYMLIGFHQLNYTKKRNGNVVKDAPVPLNYFTDLPTAALTSFFAFYS